MIFNEDSPVVKAWVRQVKNGTYRREDVPNIGNLREVVYAILDNQTN
jgi:hypothetical protein